MPSAETADQKLKYREIISTVIWSVKLGFEISKLWYSLLFVIKLLIVFLPIAETYFASQIIGELVNILATKSAVLNDKIILYIVLTIVAQALIIIADTFYNYVWIRLNSILDLILFSRYISRLSNLDMEYHEDPAFKTTLRKVDDALAWRFMQTLTNIISLISATLGLTLLGYLFIALNPILLVAVFIPIVIDYFINVKFGRDVWSIWDAKGDEKKDAEHALNGLKSKDVIQEAKIYGFGEYIAKKYKEQVKFL